jgi:mycoredoxin
MSQALTMYSTSWCGYCARLKRGLAAEGIEYTEVDIDQHVEAAATVMAINAGNRTVPTVRFSDGSALTNPTVDQVQRKLSELR